VRAALHGLILCAVVTSKKTRRSANGFRLADTADPSSAGDGDCTILDVILTHSDSALLGCFALSASSLQYFLKFTDKQKDEEGDNVILCQRT